jgi:hypothetical protein
MAPIDEAIAFWRSSDASSISDVARRFKINRSTHNKRYNGKRGSRSQATERK